MIARPLILAAVLASSLAGCGGSTGSPGTATPPPAPSGPAGNAACLQGVKPGTPGVTQIVCDGTAVVKVTGAANGQITGGTCTTSAGLFVVNAGVVTDHTFQGPRPNFLSVNTPPQGGGGQDVGATVVMGGKLVGDTGRFGGTVTFAADHKSLEFVGSDDSGDRVTIDATC